MHDRRRVLMAKSPQTCSMSLGKLLYLSEPIFLISHWDDQNCLEGCQAVPPALLGSKGVVTALPENSSSDIPLLPGKSLTCSYREGAYYPCTSLSPGLNIQTQLPKRARHSESMAPTVWLLSHRHPSSPGSLQVH